MHRHTHRVRGASPVKYSIFSLALCTNQLKSTAMNGVQARKLVETEADSEDTTAKQKCEWGQWIRRGKKKKTAEEERRREKQQENESPIANSIFVSLQLKHDVFFIRSPLVHRWLWRSHRAVPCHVRTVFLPFAHAHTHSHY